MGTLYADFNGKFLSLAEGGLLPVASIDLASRSYRPNNRDPHLEIDQ